MMRVANWGKLRKPMLLSANEIELCSPSYWDKCAVAFNENMTQLEDLTRQQISRLRLSPESTVIDVGAGSGRLTIPLAKRVEQITAVEPSGNMLAFLKANAQKEQVTNISYVNKSWDELTLGFDVYPHDVIIASLSLFMVDVEAALLKMNEAAKKQVCLYVSATNSANDELQKIIYCDSIPPWLDYMYICSILHDLGIFANVELLDFEHKQNYVSLDEAVEKLAETHRTQPEKEEKIRDYLRRALVEEEGKFWLKRNKKMAIIWWTKTNQ
jgi:ubiquinone/menaquinone biosynthesis C-methylase UbiE